MKYKINLLHACILASAVFFSGCNYTNPHNAGSVAKHGRAILVNILSSPDKHALLMDSTTDLTKLKLGDPVKVYYIGRSDILAGNTNPGIIQYTNRLVYPIYDAHGLLVSSEELQLDSTIWTIRRIGEKAALSQYNKKLSQAFTAGLTGTYLVRVPSLNLSFLAGDSGGQTRLAFLASNAKLLSYGDSISVYTTYTLSQLIPRLQAIEQIVAGKPM